MGKIPSRILKFIDKVVIDNIVGKYGYDEKKAINAYFGSETYRMLADYETGLYMYSPLVILEMWEVEQITGNPRNSAYIRLN